MTDRDKLIELLDKAHKKFIKSDNVYEFDFIADYLLANGVIAPPCKVGDVVYSLMGGFVEDMKVNRVLLSLKPNEQHPIDYIKELDDFGKTVFLTKEDAEEKLKELER